MANSTVEKHLFFANLSVEIEVNFNDFNLLWICSKNHYDISVRAMVELGGLLYGSKNKRDFDSDDIGIQVTSRELQLLLKGLEMGSSDNAQLLYKRFQAILKELIAKRGEINNQLNANK